MVEKHVESAVVGWFMISRQPTSSHELQLLVWPKYTSYGDCVTKRPLESRGQFLLLEAVCPPNLNSFSSDTLRARVQVKWSMPSPHSNCFCVVAAASG
jgi:hypothetical protein